jgi:small subunit ribosomal protein S20
MNKHFPRLDKFSIFKKITNIKEPMPIIKSAKKRQKTARKATVRNFKTKRRLKTAIKNLTKSTTLKNFSVVQSNIDKAAKKHIIHKNKAARLKRKTAQNAKKLGLKIDQKKKKASPSKKAK